MKTALILYEGMADRPDPVFEQRTPLEVARCATATDLAVSGRGGLLPAYRNKKDQRSESMLGQALGFSGDALQDIWRGPLEALAGDTVFDDAHWIFRADVVTLDDRHLISADVPGITIEETRELADALREPLRELHADLRAIAPGRMIVAVRSEDVVGLRSVPPVEAEGTEWQAAWPKNRRHKWLRSFVETSYQVLSGHPVNHVRVDLGENPANAIWPWGGGQPLAAGQGAAAVDAGHLVVMSNGLLARGFAKYVGIDMVELSNPWGTVDGKRQPFRIAGLVKALHQRDDLVVHVEAPRSGGRYGSPADKVWALECLDHVVLAPLVTVLDAVKPYRIALTVDGAVSGSGKWLKERLPVIVSGDGIEPDGVGHWDERCCAKGGLGSLTIADTRIWLRKE